MGISASNCSNLAAPFVTLAFEIAQPNQQHRQQAAGNNAQLNEQPATQTYIVECSHSEFEDVRKHFTDIFAQLDAI